MSEPSDAPPRHAETLTARLRRLTLKPVNAVARALIRLGFTANMLTVLGLLISAGAAALAALGRYQLAGVVLIAGSVFDAFDGAVARLTRGESKFGALLDSTLDRYGEAFLLTGLAYALAREDRWVGVVLACVAMMGSILVSYVRARSEGLDLDNKVGLFTRVERVALLSLALLTRLVVPGLWVLAIGANLTVVQRLWHAARSARQDQG